MLLRESFDDESQPEGSLRSHAAGAVRLAQRFIERGQREGELGQFDARRFMMWSTTYVVTFHGAPGIHRNVLGGKRSATIERQVFLDMLRTQTHWMPSCTGRHHIPCTWSHPRRLLYP